MAKQSAHVLIAGGGAAAVEAMLALRELGGDAAELDLYSPSPELVLRPLSVLQPFDRGEVLSYELTELASAVGAAFHRHSVASVDRDRSCVTLRDGSAVPYDFLLVATGTKSLWAVPGATTFWGTAHDRDVVEALAGGPGTDWDRRIIFTMPSGAGWPLPIYELALLAASQAPADAGGKLTIVTPEAAPLAVFGAEASRQSAELLAAAGIGFLPSTEPVRFDGTELKTRSGSLDADQVVSLPRLVGRRVAGMPSNSEGFVPVDEYGRVGASGNVFAAGDVTSYPVKFGGIATQQADTAAAAIAAAAWGCEAPPPFEPELRGSLITGDGSRRLPIGELRSPVSGGQGVSEPRPEEKLFGKHLTPFLGQRG